LSLAGQVDCASRPPTWTADNGDGTFTNPLFYEEFSDPDMIKVGDDFYLTGTTMHAMPGLRSRDLVNWRFVGYAMDRLDLGPQFRLENGKQIYGQGIWAPSFRHHDGVFYIFSNVNGQTTQVFRATNPAGPWTWTPSRFNRALSAGLEGQWHEDDRRGSDGVGVARHRGRPGGREHGGGRAREVRALHL
jgi:hypothetical protein